MPLANNLEFVTLAATFLAGGVAATVWISLNDNRREQAARHIARLNDQLTSLYGPLRYFLTQNDKLAKLTECHHQARAPEFAIGSSDGGRTPMSPDEASTSVLGLKNQYTERIERNNDRMIRLIEDKYSMADPEDLELVRQFAMDLLRAQAETRESGSEVPRWFLESDELIASFRSVFSEQIRRSCEAKSAELKRLREQPHQWVPPQTTSPKPSSPGREAFVTISLLILIIAGYLAFRWYYDPQRRVMDVRVPAGSSIEIIDISPPQPPRQIDPQMRVRPVPAVTLPPQSGPKPD